MHRRSPGLSTASLKAIAAGEIEKGLAAAQEAVDVADDGRPSHHVAYAALALSMAHFLTGQPDRSLEVLERAAGGPDMPLVAPSWRSYFLELLTRIRLALGDAAGAERAASLADESAEAIGLPLPRAWADRSAAHIALRYENPQRAAELALRSAQIADDVEGPLEAGLSRIVAGRALAQLRDRDRATAELEQAAATFDAVGAVRYRDEAERELRQLGHRVHRRSGPASTPDRSGVESLTQRELEIARLIVDRQPNRVPGLRLDPGPGRCRRRRVVRLGDRVGAHALLFGAGRPPAQAGGRPSAALIARAGPRARG